jgi:tetratricopeptide (TPR) repeat protein
MPAPALSERDLTVLRSFARRIDPSDAGAHNNLGVLYYQKGLIEEAIAEFARAVELDSRMLVAQANLEIAYRDSGHYDRRVAELSEEARRRPGDREPRWELGRAYAMVGRYQEAIAEFEALLALQPNDVPALLQLGLAEKARGRLDAASASWTPKIPALGSIMEKFCTTAASAVLRWNRSTKPSPVIRIMPRRTTSWRFSTGSWDSTMPLWQQPRGP